MFLDAIATIIHLCYKKRYQTSTIPLPSPALFPPLSYLRSEDTNEPPIASFKSELIYIYISKKNNDQRFSLPPCSASPDPDNAHSNYMASKTKIRSEEGLITSPQSAIAAGHPPLMGGDSRIRAFKLESPQTKGNARLCMKQNEANLAGKRLEQMARNDSTSKGFRHPRGEVEMHFWDI
ncbi:hypothetical protein TNCT_666711 [Trichonephila clavata]|uniref:Uncharacterized protein n=1 Tax=Trichonephila clavata TaxID=2740835 RepID=A0A8X6GIZ9_TRICU|nr:hypothetical protein TNCT_666711 [Trichonephila clavata]